MYDLQALDVLYTLCRYYMFTFYAPRKISGEHIVVALSVIQSVCQSISPSVRTPVLPYVLFMTGP